MRVMAHVMPQHAGTHPSDPILQTLDCCGTLATRARLWFYRTECNAAGDSFEIRTRKPLQPRYSLLRGDLSPDRIPGVPSGRSSDRSCIPVDQQDSVDGQRTPACLLAACNRNTMDQFINFYIIKSLFPELSRPWQAADRKVSCSGGGMGETG